MNVRILCVVLALITLAGCKGGSPTSPTPNGENPNCPTSAQGCFAANRTESWSLPDGWAGTSLPGGQATVTVKWVNPGQGKSLQPGQEWFIYVEVESTLPGLVLHFRKFDSQPPEWDGNRLLSSRVGSALDNIGTDAGYMRRAGEDKIVSKGALIYRIRVHEAVEWLRVYAYATDESGNPGNSSRLIGKPIDLNTGLK